MTSLLSVAILVFSCLGSPCLLERIHGCLRIGCVYPTTGVFGSAAAAITAPSKLFVGVSDANCGLSGAAVGDIPMNRAVHETPVATLCRVCLVAVIQLWVCLSGGLQSASGAAPWTLFVGVSGANSGLTGAAAGDILMNRAVHEAPVATLCRVCLVAVIQLWVCLSGVLQSVIGAAPILDYVAYVVCLLMGFVMSLTVLECRIGGSRCRHACSGRHLVVWAAVCVRNRCRSLAMPPSICWRNLDIERPTYTELDPWHVQYSS